MTTKAPTPVINNTNLKKNFDITKLFMNMDIKKLAEDIRKELLDIYKVGEPDTMIEDIGVKISKNKLGKSQSDKSLTFAFSPEVRDEPVHYVNILFKLKKPLSEMGFDDDSRMIDNLFYHANLDPYYTAGMIIPNGIFQDRFGWSNLYRPLPVIIGTIIVTDKNGKQLFHTED